ncbi:hypothetical protein K3495_g11283 [Podosphaera aphanis]|nr:hypothetical protein K3495_g11283 [Podosphaera aphanis]
MFFKSLVLRQAASTGRTPMIKFLGKRSIPQILDHHPKAHPASPSNQLPASFTAAESFSSYRQKAQQHGPLGRAHIVGVGSMSGSSLGPVTPSTGEYFDRRDLPERFRRTPINSTEIDAIETGGATLVC